MLTENVKTPARMQTKKTKKKTGHGYVYKARTNVSAQAFGTGNKVVTAPPPPPPLDVTAAWDGVQDRWHSTFRPTRIMHIEMANSSIDEIFRRSNRHAPKSLSSALS